MPKGVRLNETSFICCLAKGIPIIVIAYNKAKVKCVIEIQISPINIQIKFIIADNTPLDFCFSEITFPNGQSDKAAILN